MKKTVKKVLALALALSLALGISSIPAEAKSFKGAVASLNAPTEEGGCSIVSSWNEGDNFSPDFNSYSVSADVYLPLSLFKDDGGWIFLDPRVNFWFDDLGKSAWLVNDTAIVIGYDFEKSCPVFKGLLEGDEETFDLPQLKSVGVVGDMVKVEIVDAPVNPTLRTGEYDENGAIAWTDPIPTKGAVSPEIQVGTDRSRKGKYVVTNASIKIGDKVYKTDYNKSGSIAGFYGDAAIYGEPGFFEMKAEAFNTIGLSVAKRSVSVKKKKTATVKVTTMFSGDKVKVSSSSAKVAKATYKSGKLTIKGLKKGKATITVKANGLTEKIKVTVKK